MAKHAIFRADNCAFTKNPALLKSAKYMGSGSTATAIDNGNFVAIGGLMAGEREVHTATTPAASTTYFGIVKTPEVMYDQSGVGDNYLANFENEADAVITVGILQKGDIYSVTGEALDKVPTVGQFVELQAGTKGKVVDSATPSSTQVGKVIAIEVSGRDTYYVVEVQ